MNQTRLVSTKSLSKSSEGIFELYAAGLNMQRIIRDKAEAYT